MKLLEFLASCVTLLGGAFDTMCFAILSQTGFNMYRKDSKMKIHLLRANGNPEPPLLCAQTTLEICSKVSPDTCGNVSTICAQMCLENR